MLRAAVVMLAVFAVLTLLGARADVGVLSGSLTHSSQLLTGPLYALSWFGAVLLAPPLAIAGLAMRALRSRQRGPGYSSPTPL